ncbi:MAG: hypothetical protein CBD02_04590 [Candidatus Pelagibacter sp. TMED142]|nr:MAG: hypothetical protein CBD02_04590 [Candidatus Pelagibacter sp. TMED142]
MGQGYDTARIALAAGEARRVNMTGTEWRILSGEGLEVKAYAGNESLGVFKGAQAGRGVRGNAQFDVLQITSASNQTIEVAVSFGQVIDDTVSSSANTAQELSELPPVVCTAGSSVQIAAANANRSSLIVLNTGSVPLYLRSDNATAVSALLINPGDFTQIEVSNTIYAYNATGADGGVSVSEIGS